MAGRDPRAAGRARRRPPRGAGRALCHQPHRPPLERPAGAGHGAVRAAPRAADHHLARRPARGERGRPRLWRACDARRHQPALRPQRHRQGRGRADPGGGRRRRPCRQPLPFALVQETRAWFDGPIALSGAIASGRSILAAQAMGADFAYIGSAFIATEEARAAEAYKRMIVEGSAGDIVYSNLFTGVHGNYLRGSIANAGLDPDDLPVSDPSRMDFSSDRKKAWKDIWGSGQGIGAVTAVEPAAALVGRLRREYEAARAALGAGSALLRPG
ncbi:NAD(P)H-dependent flavin oxidoreductase [Teichococcus aestuarii]|uniref:NAD(P)H-dependent flavin oxidoreductase n=1 Tax=Teichococcus aestuarii TaxID=568898 RepID=UPI003611C77A